MSVDDVLTPLFRALLNEDETPPPPFVVAELERLLRRLRDVSGDSRPHPLATLLGDLHKPSQVAHNTASATKRILRDDETWLKKIRRRLLDQTDPTMRLVHSRRSELMEPCWKPALTLFH